MEENKVGREKNFLEKQKRYIKLRLGLFGVLVKKEYEKMDDSGEFITAQPYPNLSHLFIYIIITAKKNIK